MAKKIQWVQLTLALAGDREAEAAEILTALGADAITTAAGEKQTAWLDAAQPIRPEWDAVQVTALYSDSYDANTLIDSIVEAGLIDDPATISVEIIQDKAWEREWLAHFRPFEISKGTFVVPGGFVTPPEAEVALHIDPGLAFGTGTHPTTALCAEALSALDLSGRTVLDMGCGSGILAILALKLGATHAYGIDIDDRALEISVENASRNNVAERYSAMRPEKLPADLRTDLVIANILADTLIKLSSELCGRLTARGWLILSGVLTSQTRSIEQHYGGSILLTTTTRDQWAVLTGQRCP